MIKTYIPEFICGIGFTIIVEIVAVVVWSIYDDKKSKKS